MATALGWPITLDFKRDGMQVTFKNSGAVAEWKDLEIREWQAILENASHFSAMMAHNRSMLTDTWPGEQADYLRYLEEDYRPTQGALGQFVSRIDSPPVRHMVFSEIVRPGSVPANLKDDDAVQARALSNVYRTLEDRLVQFKIIQETLPALERSIEAVDRIRSSEGKIIERFSELAQKIEDDWAAKVLGYEAKVALQAPTSFWNERHAKQSRKAGGARIVLWVSVAALIFFVGAAVNAESKMVLPADLAAKIVVGLTHLFFFATMLAIGAWWLKQSLRDVRMLEYYAEDAAERATMIHTYAAIKGAGLEAGDLGPIIAAIYRPGVAPLGEEFGPTMPTELVLKAAVAAAGKGT